MKTLGILLCLAVASFSVACSNNDHTPKTDTNNTASTTQVVSLRVLGNCEMCQERIITAATKAGAKNPHWTPETTTFVASIAGTHLTKTAISDLIAASGHDTELKASTDSAYQNLPECCQYERTFKANASAVNQSSNPNMLLTSILIHN